MLVTTTITNISLQIAVLIILYGHATIRCMLPTAIESGQVQKYNDINSYHW